MAESLPRGISPVKWKNPVSKTRSIRYRVRIKRKDCQADRLFESLDEAKEFLDSTKTKDGRLGLTEREERDRLIREAVKEMIAAPPFRHYAKSFIETYIAPKATGKPVKDRSAKTNQARIENLLEIEIVNPGPNATGFGALLPGAKGAESRRLGDFKLDDLSPALGTSLIKKRLENCAPSTVIREISALATIWNRLKFLDAKAWERLRAKPNPFAEADKSLIPKTRKRRRVLQEGDEEKALFDVLVSRRQPELLQVVSLALATGMRRGEILFLRWSQVKEGFLELEADETKSEDDRFVILSPEAQAIIASIKKKPGKDERLFSLAIEGMKTAWQRAKKDAGCPDLRFHDLRRSFISRTLVSIQSPVVIAEMMGAKSVSHLERAFIAPIEKERRAKKGKIENEEDLRQTVAHRTSRMTHHYASLVPIKPKKG